MLTTVLVATNARGMRIGEGHQNARYTDADVDLIREMHEDRGVGCSAISAELGIPLRTVRCICSYERRAQTVEGWRKVVKET